MTEKRYGKKVDDVDDTIVNITENGNDFAWFLSDDYTDEQVDKIVQRLNKQHEENEKLKRLMRKSVVERLLDGFEKSYKDLEEENKELKDKYNEQSVEYEGLEEQVENLLDFKDKVFNLINKKLKEADKGFEQTYDSWYQGQVDALKELKKELITGESK